MCQDGLLLRLNEPWRVFIERMLVGAGGVVKCVVGRFRGKWREVARQKFPIGVIISPACTRRGNVVFVIVIVV